MRAARAPAGFRGNTVLLHDAFFAPASKPVSAADVFAVSDEMRRYLRKEMGDDVEAKGKERALYEALYSRNQLRLDYDAEITRNASEAFAARSGNCLSLAIMTAAFAKELGLTVRFQRLFSEDSWSRSGDLYFASGHVNVTLGRKNSDPRVLFQEKHVLTIDFIPPDRKAFAYEVGDQAVIAMYMNNRAAELLSRGNLDDAYWYAREAIMADPRFTGRSTPWASSITATATIPRPSA
jgi:transglutaminase-like putative cysteine protease